MVKVPDGRTDGRMDAPLAFGPVVTPDQGGAGGEGRVLGPGFRYRDAATLSRVFRWFRRWFTSFASSSALSALLSPSPRARFARRSPLVLRAPRGFLLASLRDAVTTVAVTTDSQLRRLPRC